MEGEFTGHVKEGKMHGVGVCVYTDSSRYQGDWKAGLKHGRGTHSFASGDQFEGEWETGWMHGLGVYTWKIGDKCAASFSPLVPSWRIITASCAASCAHAVGPSSRSPFLALADTSER